MKRLTTMVFAVSFAIAAIAQELEFGRLCINPYISAESGITGQSEKLLTEVSQVKNYSSGRV